VVTHPLQIERRPGKVRLSETDVLTTKLRNQPSTGNQVHSATHRKTTFLPIFCKSLHLMLFCQLCQLLHIIKPHYSWASVITSTECYCYSLSSSKPSTISPQKNTKTKALKVLKITAAKLVYHSNDAQNRFVVCYCVSRDHSALQFTRKQSVYIIYFTLLLAEGSTLDEGSTLAYLCSFFTSIRILNCVILLRV